MAHTDRTPPWRSQRHKLSEQIEPYEDEEPKRLPRGGYAIIAASVLGTELTRLALMAGVLAVEFASAAAQSDESLFYGLRGGRKVTGGMFMAMGMLASSMASALLTMTPPVRGPRDTTLAVFFLAFSVMAVIELMLLLTVTSMDCDLAAARSGDTAAEWACDRAPALMALGIPLGLPTLGGRLIVMVAAWKGRSPEEIREILERVADKKIVSVMDVGQMSPYAKGPYDETPRSGGALRGSPQHSEASGRGSLVYLEDGSAIFSPPAALARQERDRDRDRQGTKASGLRHRGRGKRRETKDDSDSCSSSSDSMEKSKRERESRNWRQAEEALAKCRRSQEELEHKASASAASLQGLDMYAKSLGGEVRRLSGMMDAHVTHRKALETRVTITEQRSPSLADGPHSPHHAAHHSPHHAPHHAAHIEKMRSDFESLLNEQMAGLRRQCDGFAQQLQEVSAAANIVGMGKAEAGVKGFQQQLVEAVAMPQSQLNDAHKLALRLLRQASEVAAILCAGHMDSDSKDLRRLRVKYNSARDLKELVKTAITEKVREVLDAPGRYGAEAVNKALADRIMDDGDGSLAFINSSEKRPVSPNSLGRRGGPVFSGPGSGDAIMRNLYEESYESYGSHGSPPYGSQGPHQMRGPRPPGPGPPMQVMAPPPPNGYYLNMRPRMMPQAPPLLPFPAGSFSDARPMGPVMPSQR